MCAGAYFLAREVSDEALLRILETLEAREEECKRSGDIFPTDAAPALALGRILTMRWGFPRPGGGQVVINARSETATEKPLFRGALRCLLPASWLLRVGRGKAQVRFTRPGGLCIWRAVAAGADA